MTSVGEATRDATRALAALADRHAQGFPRVAAALRATREHLDRRLDVEVVRVLLVGGPAAKRSLLAAIAGDELFGAAPRPSSATLSVTRGASDRYFARMRDGTSEDFARAHPDRRRWYEDALAKARADVDATTATLAAIEQRLASIREETTRNPIVDPPSFWARLVAWILALLGRPAPALPAPVSQRRGSEEVEAMIERRDLKRAREEATLDLAKAQAKADRLQDEGGRHRDERRRAFVAGVRQLLAAGDGVLDATIEVAGDRVPADIVLVDAPPERWRALREEVCGCIAVAMPGTFDVAELEAAIHPLVPRVLDADRLEEGLSSTLESVRAQAPLAAIALATSEMPPRIGSLAKAALDAEAEHRARVEALERERLPAPEAFRAEQLGKTAGAIDEGAERVVARAKEQLHARVAELENEWTTALEACPDRAALARRALAIDAAAPEKVRALVDAVGDDVGAEMQAVSENLQVWVLAEVRQQYRTRYLHVDPTSVVVAELPSDALAPAAAPLRSTIVRSGRRRLGFGLGGALVCAAIGTAVEPVLGTVIGAVLGLLLWFVERTRTLRASCVARARAWLAAVESSIAERLDASREVFARDIRLSVEETIEQALKRRDQSIMRLIDDEARSIAEEQEKLRQLAELREALETQAATFASLADAAAAELRALRSSRT